MVHVECHGDALLNHVISIVVADCFQIKLTRSEYARIFESNANKPSNNCTVQRVTTWTNCVVVVDIAYVPDGFMEKLSVQLW